MLLGALVGLLAIAEAFTPTFYPVDDALDPWTQLKNRHEGERCLYIGNGPSLNRVAFEDVLPHFDVIMGVNKIYLGFDRFGFVPNYYSTANAKVIEQAKDEIVAMPKEMVKFIRSDRWSESAAFNRENNIVLFNSISQCADNGATCKVLGKFKPEACSHCPNCFCDASKYVVEGNTITYISMQLLAYIGCRTVVLIGVDHSFRQEGKPNSAQVMDGPDPNHFDPRYFGGQKWDLADLDSSELHYHIAKKHFHAHCGQIIDATVGGKLDIFTKSSLEEVILPRVTLYTVVDAKYTDAPYEAYEIALQSWVQLRPRPTRIVLITKHKRSRRLADTLAASYRNVDVVAARHYSETSGGVGSEHLMDMLAADNPDMLLFLASGLTTLSSNLFTSTAQVSPCKNGCVHTGQPQYVAVEDVLMASESLKTSCDFSPNSVHDMLMPRATPLPELPATMLLYPTSKLGAHPAWTSSVSSDLVSALKYAGARVQHLPEKLNPVHIGIPDIAEVGTSAKVSVLMKENMYVVLGVVGIMVVWGLVVISGIGRRKLRRR